MHEETEARTGRGKIRASVAVCRPVGLRPDGERGRPVVRRFVVDVQAPQQPFAAGKRKCSEVDAERNPKLASRRHSGGASGLELAVERDRLFSDGDGATVLIDEIEAPMVLHIGLVPRHAYANSDRHLLWTGSDNPKPSAQDEELAVRDLHRITHENDRLESGRGEHEIRLVHGDDPTASMPRSGLREERAR